MNKKLYLSGFILIFLISFISAGMVVGDTSGENSNEKVVELVTIIPLNVSTALQVFNMSEIWITDEGNMDNVPDLYPTLDLRYLELSGGTMTGDINMNSNEIHNLAGLNLTQDINLDTFNWLVPTPILPNHTANKDYVDDATSSTAFDFFFNNDASNIVGHFNMTESDLERPENTLDSASLGAGTFSIFNWTTLVGQPEFNELRQGVYDVHVHLQVDGAGRKPVTITPKLYNISADGLTRSLLVIFEISDTLTSSGIEYDLHGVLTSPVMLNNGERLNLELEATVGATGANPIVTITLEGTTDSHLSVQTSSNAFEKIFIRRDGTNTLVGDWQVDSVANPFNINMFGNISLDTFFGDGSQLTNVLHNNSSPTLENLNVSNKLEVRGNRVSFMSTGQWRANWGRIGGAGYLENCGNLLCNKYFDGGTGYSYSIIPDGQYEDFNITGADSILSISTTGNYNFKKDVLVTGLFSAQNTDIDTDGIDFTNVPSILIQNIAGGIDIKANGDINIAGVFTGLAKDTYIGATGGVGGTAGNVILGADFTDWVIVDSNLGLNVSTKLYVQGSIENNGTFITHSPSIFCGAEEDVCYGIDFTTKEADWCQKDEKGDWYCDNNNVEILKKLSSVKAREDKKETCLSNNYAWRKGECFENVLTQTDYNGAVESYNNPIMEEYNCMQLNRDSLQEVSSTCLRETAQTKLDYRFKENCGWNKDDGYYCLVREVR